MKHGNEVSGDLPPAHIDRRDLFENSVGENSRWLGSITGKAFSGTLLWLRVTPSRTQSKIPSNCRRKMENFWLRLGSLHNWKKKRVLCNTSEWKLKVSVLVLTSRFQWGKTFKVPVSHLQLIYWLVDTKFQLSALRKASSMTWKDVFKEIEIT